MNNKKGPGIEVIVIAISAVVIIASLVVIIITLGKGKSSGPSKTSTKATSEYAKEEKSREDRTEEKDTERTEKKETEEQTEEQKKEDNEEYKTEEKTEEKKTIKETKTDYEEITVTEQTTEEAVREPVKLTGEELIGKTLDELIELMGGDFELEPAIESRYKQQYFTDPHGLSVIYNESTLPGVAVFVHVDVDGVDSAEYERIKNEIKANNYKLEMIGIYDGLEYNESFYVGMTFAEAEVKLNNYDIRMIAGANVARQNIRSDDSVSVIIWYDSRAEEKDELMDSNPVSDVILIIPRG